MVKLICANSNLIELYSYHFNTHFFCFIEISGCIFSLKVVLYFATFGSIVGHLLEPPPGEL